MTMCQSHHRVEADPHAYAPPTYVDPVVLDASEAGVFLAKARRLARSRLLEDRRAAVEAMRDLAIWANDVADSLEDAE